MAILTALDRVEIGALLARYGVRPTAVESTTHGTENTNYFVTDGSHEPARQLVLTLVEHHALTPQQHDFVATILATCARRGLPTPRVVATGDGHATTTWNDKPVLLCTRLPGDHKQHVSDADCLAIGRFLANFHRATETHVATAPAHPRDLLWLRRHVDRFARDGAPWQAELLTTAFATTRALLHRDDVRQLPQRIVHGDLFRDNALFTRHGLSGVIDFHHAARHARILDIAVTANDWCVDANGDRDDERWHALLRGYQSSTPLLPLELALLPCFRIYAALSFALSRLAGNAARADYGKSALPMLQRLARCLAS